MFDHAELGHSLSKKDFEAALPPMREALLEAQYNLLETRAFPVIVLVNGFDGAGRGETVNQLNEWLDPRHVQTQAFGDPTEEERLRPPMWRYWQALPPKGKVGVLFGSWYSPLIDACVAGDIKPVVFEHALADLRHFEQMLVAEGALIVKYWFHLTKAAQKARLKALAADPETAWQVTAEAKQQQRDYDRIRTVADIALRETSTAEAPWLVVDGSDPHYRAMMVGHTLHQAISDRLAQVSRHPEERRRPSVRGVKLVPPLDHKTLLGTLDYQAKLSATDYSDKLNKQQRKLGLASRDPGFQKRSLVIVFEGNDAAGKGGAIRRVTQALDARSYRVIPIAAPTDEERAQPYLWRFWRNLPRQGRIAIFDRSWYGRVLVERVEGFAAEGDWRRAYDEINQFEEQLVEAGTTVVKIWLAITPEEQLARFKERETTTFKRHKITPDDWRNRDKWSDYAAAAEEMFERTSTSCAPWQVIPANNKQFARVEVLKAINAALKGGDAG